MTKQRKSLRKLFRKCMTVLTGLSISAYVFYISTIYAWASGTSAESRFDAVIAFLVPWIEKLGGVVMLVGGIMFALGFKNDDADSKTRGLQTMIAGGITIAVGAGYTTFIS